jgi:phospholipid transport system substrate-binding protein
MKNPIKHFIVTFLLLLSSNIYANELEDIHSMMDTKISSITTTLANKSLGKEKQNKAILDVVNPVFDFALMAKLSLGKSEWTQLTPPQRKTYTTLFIHRAQNSYLEKLHLYTDEKVKVEKAILIKRNRIEVPSFIIAKDGETKILYKFYQTRQKAWKIYDVEIAGVSIVQTYRSQFAEILQSSNIEGLLSKMQSM